MDTGLTLKPAASTAQTGAQPAARNAAPTELAPAQTVTAASNTAPATSDPHGRQIIIDPHSREVIYRAVDVRSRRVVRQEPGVVARRLKAYARSAEDNAHPHDPLADFEV
jgi:flagellar protein FlaG